MSNESLGKQFMRLMEERGARAIFASRVENGIAYDCDLFLIKSHPFKSADPSIESIAAAMKASRSVIEVTERTICIAHFVPGVAIAAFARGDIVKFFGPSKTLSNFAETLVELGFATGDPIAK